MPARLEVIAGPDGPVAVDWVYPGAEQLMWTLDREHYSRPLTPLELWFYAHHRAGVERAWEEVELVPPNIFVSWQFVGPFLYYCDTSTAPERYAQVQAGIERIVDRFGSPQAFWEEYCEPRVADVCSRLVAGADEPFTELAEAWGYAWHQTFTSCAVVDHYLDQLVELLVPAMGPDGALVAQELAHAGDNASQDVDAQIWHAAQLLQAEGLDSETVRAECDRLVAQTPNRSMGWALDDPTWSERPDLVLALVQALATGAEHPDERARRREQRRAAALDEALAALDRSDHDRCRALVDALDEYVGVREGRAYWQMTLMGSTRRLACDVGARLVAAGRIDAAEDTLFLEPPEWQAGARVLYELVERRRADYAQWCSIEPPPVIGVVDAGNGAAGAARSGELRGTPVSRGVASGPARIVRVPDDWDRVEPGDVLVCPLTTPAWTPLFALVAAVVTETGNMYSHPAITAREYGIPGVAAVDGACARISDGQAVTVDGTTGIVRLGG